MEMERSDGFGSDSIGCASASISASISLGDAASAERDSLSSQRAAPTASIAEPLRSESNSSTTDAADSTTKMMTAAACDQPAALGDATNTTTTTTTTDQDRLLQLLCDFPDGFTLLLREAKKSISSAKEAVAFLKKRAEMEDQYAKSMIKAAQMAYKTEGKTGSFGTAWQQFGKIHEKLGMTHAKLSETLNELAEEISLMQKDTERSRKSLKEGHARRIKDVQDADAALEKCRVKYEQASEEWEKSIMHEQQQAQQQAMMHSSTQSMSHSQFHPSIGGGVGIGMGHGGFMGSSNHAANNNSPSIHRKFTMAKSMTNTITFLKSGLEKNFKRTEEDARVKAAVANENYKSQLHTTNLIRTEFYGKYLPQFVRHLKQTLDDADERLCQYLTRYTDIVTRARLDVDMVLSPVNDPREGLIKLTEEIHVRRDLEEAALELTKSRPIDKNDREYVAYKGTVGVAGGGVAGGGVAGVGSSSNATGHGSLFGGGTGSTIGSSVAPNSDTRSASPHTLTQNMAPAAHAFGVPLSLLSDQETMENPVPIVVVRCIEYIENNGITTPGIYRVSGSSTHLQKLKHHLDRDPVGTRLDLLVEDVHAVTGVLKLFFRELPEPLIPRHLYRQFIESAKIDDERMRLIQTHELVNTLDDAHYATLKGLAGHLWRVQSASADNKMSMANLGIVWGPTLMDSPDTAPDASELKLQSKVIETVINNFEHIFDTE